MAKKYAVEGLDGYPNELAHKLDDALDALDVFFKVVVVDGQEYIPGLRYVLVVQS